jgi:hypothetical protein
MNVLPNLDGYISSIFPVAGCVALRDGTCGSGGVLLLSHPQYRQVSLALFSCYKIGQHW